MKSKNILSDSKDLLGLFLSFLLLMPFFGPPHSYAIERQKVRDDGLVATYYYNQKTQQQPPVIIFGGSSGGNFYDKYQNYMEDLVESGYAVLSLSYFDYNSTGELPAMLRHIPLEYFERAMNWMARQPQTSKGKFAVIGNSRGGEAALLLATQYPKISTVIAIVPSAYVGGAYNNKKVVTGSAWTLHGKEIPYIDYQRAAANYSPWWKVLENIDEVKQFAIPVEKMSAAVLLLSGINDEIWPSTEMSKRIMQRLEKYHYPFPRHHIAYEASHNIRMISWPDALRFIKKHHPAQK